MTQDKEDRKQSIAKSRSKHHNKQLENNLKRLDAYVLEDTKLGLKKIKAVSPAVKNEGQAVDLAVQLALEYLNAKLEC